MSFAIFGARRLSPRLSSCAAPSRPASSGLLLLCPPTSSLFAPIVLAQSAGYHSLRNLPLPTCPTNRDTCPSSLGVRAFHSTAHNWKSTPHFSYQVASSYCAKQHNFDAEADLFTADVFDPAKSNFSSLRECKKANGRKRPNSGQDAFFYSQVGTTDTTAFGVADGVGGWMDSGLDPADFSHGLCEYMACAARAWPRGSTRSSLHPKDLLQLGYDEVMRDQSIIGGGSTACIAVAEPDGSVQVANLGDSGFMHLGPNAVRHFTEPQIHAFNTPFQLSKTPKRMLVQMAVFGGPSTLSDKPKESSVTHHNVRHGDVLVFATDGVWDNISPQDTLGIVSRHMVHVGAWVEKDDAMEVGEGLSQLAQAASDGKADGTSLQARLSVAIAKEAKEAGLNTRRDGPFAKEVQKYYPGEDWHGGKPDDIAVVIAVVVEKDPLG